MMKKGGNIERLESLETIESLFSVHPAVAILGPRQCGKTTLAHLYGEGFAGSVHYFDLERAPDQRQLGNPEQALSDLEGLVVIDEIQRQPELFESLRVLIDRLEGRVRFLLLGSAAPQLIRRSSETLAGRVGFFDLSGFALEELGVKHWKSLWLRGGFPRSYLAKGDEASYLWRENFARTFLERDIPQLGINIAAERLMRFWTMIAHYHGQVWNGAEFARSMGTSEVTVRKYLDILAGAFMVRIVPPWFENMKKRQVKSPRIYLRDSGLLHSLLEVSSYSALLSHPKLGASWEGFVMEQILHSFPGRVRNASFWSTHSGAEIDLLLSYEGKRYGFEVKFSDDPVVTRSMLVAQKDLHLARLFVVYPGKKRYFLAEGIEVLPIEEVVNLELG